MKIAIACLLGILAAVTCVVATKHKETPNTIDYYATRQFVTLSGTITAEPDRRPMQTKYVVNVDSVKTASGVLQHGIRGNVLITDKRMWPEYYVGDSVIVRGTLEKPEAIEEFAYDKYLSRFSIYAVIYRASLEHRSTTHSLRRALFDLKSTVEAQINRLYAEPHASFMAGLLTGSRKGIPEDVMQAFHATGLTHIIAISGYNITIILTLVGSALFFMPLKLRFVPLVVGIVLFTIFVGASAAVVRACIMGILGLIALQTGRVSDARLSLLWTGVFMAAWNPRLLWYDAGFQLSFLAVIGLIECAPLLETLCSKLPETLAIRESLQMTIAAQLAALPVIVILFGRLSLVSPLANVLIAPVLPLAMLFGALGTLTSFALFPLGQLFAALGFLCLEWILLVATLLSRVPFASIDMHMPIWLCIPYYLVLITICIKAASSRPSAMARA